MVKNLEHVVTDNNLKVFTWKENQITTNEIVYSDIHEMVIEPNGNIKYTVFNNKGEIISSSKGRREYP